MLFKRLIMPLQGTEIAILPPLLRIRFDILSNSLIFLLVPNDVFME
jgi:hypothetical protein